MGEDSASRRRNGLPEGVLHRKRDAEARVLRGGATRGAVAHVLARQQRSDEAFLTAHARWNFAHPSGSRGALQGSEPILGGNELPGCDVPRAPEGGAPAVSVRAARQ